MSPHEREILELLAGRRTGKARRQAAVRIEDVAGLLELPPRLKSMKASGATPTKAEFDALVADMQALHRCLLVVVTALQSRVLP